jgi:DNA-binding NarL/FixJ family response regulator
VVWHPQRLIGLALLEGLRAQGAIGSGYLAVDVEAALGAGLNADIVLVASRDVVRDEFLDLIEALHYRRHDVPVLSMRSLVTVDVVVEDLLLGARGTLWLRDSLSETVAGVLAATRGLLVLPPSVQAGVISALSARARGRLAANEVLASLTARERTVLEHLVNGMTVPHIARKLSVSTNTVRTYLHRLRAKLDARTQLQLAARGRELLSVGGGTASAAPSYGRAAS